MEKEERTLRNSKLWAGLTGLFSMILVISLLGQPLALANGSFINTALGTSTSKIVETEEPGDTTYYKSTFGAFDDPDAQAAAIQAAFRQNIEEMREGAVLLHNNKALPMTAETKITVLGHGAVDPAYQGSSAGTKVSNDSLNVVTLKDALEASGFSVNETVWTALQGGTAARGVLATTPWGGTSIQVTGSAAGTEESKEFYSALTGSFADYNDAAIVVFTREGSEGTDLIMNDVDDDGTTPMSSLALHQNEKDLLALARENFSKVIVLLNSPYQMEVHEIRPYADAILFIGYPGHQGFTGVAEILRGTVNPSGKLADTYATSSLSAPATVNSGTNTPQFANAAEINETIGQDESAEYVSFQAEGIYIGYRYYETRYADCVMGQGNAADPTGALAGAAKWDYAAEVQYPFGYGLSYTGFRKTLDNVEVGEDEITVTATVTNIGSAAGKNVVEIYAQTPYGEYERANHVEKSAVQLVGFAKTQILEPGASETVTIPVDKYLLASYDYVGAKGYILSEGNYYLAIGNDAHDAINNILAAQGYTAENGMTAAGDPSRVFQFSMGFDAEKYRTGANGTEVTNQFDDCDINYWVEGAGTYLSRSDWAGTFPVSQTVIEATPEMMEILDGEWYEKPADAPSYESVAANFGKNNGLTVASMKDVPLEDRQAWLDFIYQLQPEDLPNATAESFSCPAVGDISPSFPVGDGCDSVGGTYPIPTTVDGAEVSIPTTRYCSNVILTGTFNSDLYAGRGLMMGEDGLWSGFMINYNVGNDLHRTPFGGRNYEYMSECPNLNYLAAIPQVEATEKTGSHAAPKHFVGNDQEFYRSGVLTFFNEQAFREGDLRAFEGGVRVAKAGGIMQSFERLGLKWTSASTALNTNVLRKEWGWQGAIDTDAAPCFGEYVDGGYLNHAAEVLDAGTQEWCLDGVGGHGGWVLQKAKDTDDGHLLELLVEAAISWEYAISRSCVINGMSSTARVVQITPWWQTAIQYVIYGAGILTLVSFLMLVASKFKKSK